MTKTQQVTQDLRDLAAKYPPARGAWRPGATGSAMSNGQFILQDFQGECYVVTVQKVGLDGHVENECNRA